MSERIPNDIEKMDRLSLIAALEAAQAGEEKKADMIAELDQIVKAKDAEIERLTESGNQWGATAMAYLARAEAAEAALKEAREALRGMFCPRPCNGRPDDLDVGDCFGRGERGMQLSITLPKALFQTPELAASIKVESPTSEPVKIDATAAAEALSASLGVPVDLRIIEPGQ